MTQRERMMTRKEQMIRYSQDAGFCAKLYRDQARGEVR
jgi:hypothetical protein